VADSGLSSVSEPFSLEPSCFGTFRQEGELFKYQFFGTEDTESGIKYAGGVAMSVFDEKYRVVAVESDRLLLRGVHSGDVLTIVNSEPEVPLTQEEYPLGKLIALTDPSSTPLN
jgi:hypothetical protein